MNCLVTVLGVVQGVGYRPFVARLATELGITGTVRNSGGTVQIIAQGDQPSIDRFVGALKEKRPPGADVTQVLVEKSVQEQPYTDFHIIKSTGITEHTPLLPTDLPMCETCREELLDPGNRRFGYSFISCVDCGPRYSIMEAIPYDRDTITMSTYLMCPSCTKEYTEDSRRRHAQTISCHDCGPQLILALPGLTLEKKAALDRATQILTAGGVLAIKGIGGYQLACRPDSYEAVDALRKLKNRDRKPFAVMFPDLDGVKAMCRVSGKEEELLLSAARPIVLLGTKHPADLYAEPGPQESAGNPEPAGSPVDSSFCAAVNGESRFQGAFLPYTALHQQLTDACGPLVMTSANLSDEPIIYRDEDILKISSPYLSGVLYNTRRIVTPLDDSVARVVSGKSQLIRRSRGYVPSPIILTSTTPRTILAMGGDLKAGFCLYQENRAYLSQYFGDMDSYQVQKNYSENILHMQNLFHIRPEIIACDLHPLYRTSELAAKWTHLEPENEGGLTTGNAAGHEAGHAAVTPAGIPLQQPVLIQHHHAHAASVMAEHGIDSCIGVTFDGTGYGTDGTIWGGEFLLCKGAGYTREAHLGVTTLCGGDEAARQADLTASCYLFAAGEPIRHKDAPVIRAALLEKSLTQQTSSMGRLFDAVSSVLGICSLNSYEGECAVMLENAAAQAVSEGILPFPLHFTIEHGKHESTADPIAVLYEIFRAVNSGCDKKALALGFHMAVAEMVVSLCRHIGEKGKETRVVLSGGVFANLLLAEKCAAELGKIGFAVYQNESVPVSDGGISLGQAWICGQMLKQR